MPQPLSSTNKLRQVRWALLDARDRLIVEQKKTGRMPWSARLWLLTLLLSLIVHLISLPIYITRSPQKNFSAYARRSGSLYLDSFTSFQRSVQFTLNIILVTVIALVLAVVSAGCILKIRP